jgi:uncharacterized membrane protein
MLQKLGRYYPLQLEIVPLLLFIFILYFVFSNYSNLPAQIPTHFDIHGAVDGRGARANILIFPIAAAFVYLLLGAICLAFAVIKDPKNLINLPQKTKDAIGSQSAEELRAVMLRSLFALKLVVFAMMTYLAYYNVQMALGKDESLGIIWLPLFLVALFAVIGYMLFQVFSLAGSKKSPPGPGGL